MGKMVENGKFSTIVFGGGRHYVGGIDHGSMPDKGEIKICNN